MDSYAADGQINIVTPAPGDTALGIIANTLTRAKIHLFIVSAGGTPADNVLQWLIRRFNAVGTFTPVVPVAIDPGGPASQLTAGENYTVEPTYTLTLFDIAVHQRAVFQWNAAPGKELVIPAIAANGIGFTPIHAAYALAANATAHWME